MTSPTTSRPSSPGAGNPGGIPLHRFALLDSTQAEARRRLPGALGPFACQAGEQSAGVGRLGRRWHSPPGGLWLTVAIPGAAAPPGTISLDVGRIVCDLCRRVLEDDAQQAESAGPAPLTLKPPNDVLLRARKVAGILVEVVPVAAVHWSLVGVGINIAVDVSRFPADLLAATLLQPSAHDPERLAILSARLAAQIAALIPAAHP